jgi:broad specificity phosphatase PhoE/predicted kinase
MTPVALVMVGLPARGKSYTARKISRYLTWLGHKVEVFNVGNYRRTRLGPSQPHDFFDPGNRSGADARRALAAEALDDAVAFLRQGGEVALYDATNSTRERRALARRAFLQAGATVIFVESICEDEAIIEANIRETKAGSPDYAGVAEATAVDDFRARIAHYARSYEAVRADEGPSVKIIDVGRRIELNEITGDLPSRVVFFLLNLHIQPRRLWLSRHGESQYNVVDRIGGDPGLTRRGELYARSLAEHVRGHVAAEAQPLQVWTSSLRRTRDTARPLHRPSTPWKALDEIDAGTCDGMTYTEIAQRLPAEWAARQADKLRYRYPQGESYQDIIRRLEPVILAMERERQPLLVISHQAVLRALYVYLMDRPLAECPRVPIPLHTLIELRPTAYGCEERRTPIAIPSVVD